MERPLDGRGESEQAACAPRGFIPRCRSRSEDLGWQHTQRHQLRPARDTETERRSPQRNSWRLSPLRIARL